MWVKNSGPGLTQAGGEDARSSVFIGKPVDFPDCMLYKKL